MLYIRDRERVLIGDFGSTYSIPATGLSGKGLTPRSQAPEAVSQGAVRSENFDWLAYDAWSAGVVICDVLFPPLEGDSPPPFKAEEAANKFSELGALLAGIVSKLDDDDAPLILGARAEEAVKQAEGLRLAVAG